MTQAFMNITNEACDLTIWVWCKLRLGNQFVPHSKHTLSPLEREAGLTLLKRRVPVDRRVKSNT